MLYKDEKQSTCYEIQRNGKHCLEISHTVFLQFTFIPISSKKKCDVSRGREEFYLGGCETNKADKSSKGRGQKNRVRGSCHRSMSPTGLFVKSCVGAQGPSLLLYGINCPEP